MVWFHGGWAVSGDAWGLLGEYNGAQLARIHAVAVVSAQYRLAVFGFVVLDGSLGDQDAVGVDTSVFSAHWAFEDQRSLLVWVQDNAAGLSYNKTAVVIFGHNAGGWSVCTHILHTGREMVLDGRLFTGAIMQSGFCDDMGG